MTKTIGFICLGVLDSAITKNILDCRLQVIGYNTGGDAQKKTHDMGIVLAESLYQVSLNRMRHLPAYPMQALGKRANEANCR